MKNIIIHGNCIEILRSIDSQSIASVITDPPYNYEFVGKDWDEDEIKRRTEKIKDSSTLVKNIPYGSGLAGGVRNERWYQKQRENNKKYTDWVGNWGEEIYRVTKPGSPVAVFNSTRTIAHVQVALEQCGFYTRDILVYRRNSGIPRGLNVSKKAEKEGWKDYQQWEGWNTTFRGEWEAILLVQKPLENNYINTLEKYNVGVFDTQGLNGSFKTNIIEGISNRSNSKLEHCTVKPLDLMKYLVSTLVPKIEGNIILDPFAGSGTTLLAAKELGYDYLGIEIEARYIPIIEKRLNTRN